MIYVSYKGGAQAFMELKFDEVLWKKYRGIYKRACMLQKLIIFPLISIAVLISQLSAKRGVMLLIAASIVAFITWSKLVDMERKYTAAFVVDNCKVTLYDDYMAYTCTVGGNFQTWHIPYCSVTEVKDSSITLNLNFMYDNVIHLIHLPKAFDNMEKVLSKLSLHYPREKYYEHYRV